jgi:hypothetical protein
VTITLVVREGMVLAQTFAGIISGDETVILPSDYLEVVAVRR